MDRFSENVIYYHSEKKNPLEGDHEATCNPIIILLQKEEG